MSNVLIQEAQDYQLVHGGMLKHVTFDHAPPVASARMVGISLAPSPFPRLLFEEARDLQVNFQELYIAVAKDPEWLKEALKDLLVTDLLIRTLWSVFENVQGRRTANTINLCAGIFRSDYMIHADESHDLKLKQVEFNTIACAGAAHGQRVVGMHRHFRDIGMYRDMSEQPSATNTEMAELNIPMCDNIKGIVDTLEVAHSMYMTSHWIRSSRPGRVCVLMIVQPHNFNIADERPVEYGLQALSPPVMCYRLEWGRNVLEHTTLTSTNKLMYHPPHLAQSYQVSVVYFRAGFETREYEGSLKEIGIEIRTRLEVSDAVKCPDILTHLTTSKKIQQSLCRPGSVERFLNSDKSEKVRRTFMRMYPLDETALGADGKRLARDGDTATSFVLKPNREGGGHNVYREDIPSFLRKIPEHAWNQYILMEMIEPVVGVNSLVSLRGIWQGDVLAEVGIWGGAVWQVRGVGSETLLNQQFGWSVRSKVPNVDEVSVVKGFGCFDSVALLDVVKGQPVYVHESGTTALGH